MGNSLRLGRIFGIPFGVNYSWFIVFVLVTASLAGVYFPGEYPTWGYLTWWSVGLVTSLLFFVSVLAHELAHSLVSMANGVPVHSITLFIFGGVARVAREAHRPAAELTMALAGPACSLGLGALFATLWLLLGGFSEPVAALAGWLAAINVSLAVFNMVPGFPLDGGRVLRALIWKVSGDFRRATRIATSVGRIIAYAFIFGGILAVFYQYWNGLWFAFLGWFLDRAAVDSYRQVALRDVLGGVRASDLISYRYRVVPLAMPVSSLSADFGIPAGRSCCLVADSGRLLGLVTVKQVAKVAEQLRDTTLVGDIMTPWAELSVVQPDDDVFRIIELIERQGAEHVPVMDGGIFVGLIDKESLDRFLRAGRQF